MKTFRFCYLLLAAGICLLADVARAERAWKIPEGFQWGVTFGFYATNGYFSSSVAKDEIEAIARAGATWVTVVPTVWQDEGASAFQYKDFAHTPNDIELMDAIDLIHAKGMKVQLRPMLECKDGYGRLGVWMNKDRERVPGVGATGWVLWNGDEKKPVTVERDGHHLTIGAERGGYLQISADGRAEVATEF